MCCKKCDSLGKTSSWKNFGVHGLLYRCMLLHRMNTCVWIKGSKYSITRGFSPSPPNYSTKYFCDALLKYQFISACFCSRHIDFLCFHCKIPAWCNHNEYCYDDVLWAIFTQKNFWVPKRDSNAQPSDRWWDTLVPLENSEIFLSKIARRTS